MRWCRQEATSHLVADDRWAGLEEEFKGNLKAMESETHSWGREEGLEEEFTDNNKAVGSET